VNVCGELGGGQLVQQVGPHVERGVAALQLARLVRGRVRVRVGVRVRVRVRVRVGVRARARARVRVRVRVSWRALVAIEPEKFLIGSQFQPRENIDHSLKAR